MGQESPHKDKPSLEKLPEYLPFKGTRLSEHDRSNLEIAHGRNLARAITYSQTAMSILVLGATIVAFLYLILRDIEVTILERFVICSIILSVFALLAGKRAYLSWRHHLKAQFIENELLGVPHTWEITPKIDEKLKQFMEYEYDEKLKQPRKRRYLLHLDKILKHIP